MDNEIKQHLGRIEWRLLEERSVTDENVKQLLLMIYRAILINKTDELAKLVSNALYQEKLQQIVDKNLPH